MADVPNDDSLNAEAQPAGCFQLDVPLDTRALTRVAALENLPTALEANGVLLKEKAMATTVVRVVEKEIQYSQIVLLDPTGTQKHTWAISANVLFAKAPEGARLAIKKKMSESIFQPGNLYSDWLDSGRLDLTFTLNGKEIRRRLGKPRRRRPRPGVHMGCISGPSYSQH